MTTSARRSQPSPFTVMSSGSPGPAPTRTTRPLDTEPLQETGARLVHVAGSGEPSQLVVEGLTPALGGKRDALVAKCTPHFGHDVRERGYIGGQQRLQLLPYETGHGRAGSARRHCHGEGAALEHRGEDEAAVRGIVCAVDEHAALAAFSRHRGVHRGVVGSDHGEDEAVHVARHVFARPPAELGLGGEAKQPLGERGADHGDARSRLHECLHLSRGDGSPAHHEARMAHEVEHHRVREAGPEGGAHEAASGGASGGDSGTGAWRSGRGKNRTSRSSTCGSSSHGTSSMMRVPARGSAPPRPPTKTCTPSTIFPCTLTLHPWSPISAVWWFPQEAGQPDQRTVMGRVLPTCFSKSLARAMARVFVSMRARLQKSVPVQETRPRRTSEGL